MHPVTAKLIERKQPALPVATKTVLVSNRLGLHARPSALLVKTLRPFDTAVTVQKGTDRVDAKSILGVMMLAAGHGTTLTFAATGKDAGKALDAIQQLFDRQFDEAYKPDADIQQLLRKL